MSCIGAHCRIEPYVYVKRWTTLGERNEISAGTVLGTDPLDKHFTGERSYLRIGDGNIIREHYTISRGTQPESVDRNRRWQLHHDVRTHRAQLQNRQQYRDRELRAGGRARGCGRSGVYLRRRGDSSILEDRAAGHDRRQLARESGRAAVLPVHRFQCAAEWAEPGWTEASRVSRTRRFAALKVAYKILYRSGLKLKDALERITAELDTEHTRHLVKFIREQRAGNLQGMKSGHVATLLKSTRAQLTAAADPKFEAGLRWFFKEPVKPYGVRTPLVRELARLAYRGSEARGRFGIATGSLPNCGRAEC